MYYLCRYVISHFKVPSYYLRVGQNAWSLQILAPQLFFERFIYEMITVWISDHFFKISLYLIQVINPTLSLIFWAKFERLFSTSTSERYSEILKKWSEIQTVIFHKITGEPRSEDFICILTHPRVLKMA